jgi:hypothetical protein
MRWNCPHCGVALAVSDEKLGGGWSFSRCFKCGGFALVRRSDINLIKVDRAPTGEKVILPESSEEPMMTAAAAQKLARYGGAPAEAAAGVAADRPTIRPGARRNANPTAPIAAIAKPAARSDTAAGPPVPVAIPKPTGPRYAPKVEARGISIAPPSSPTQAVAAAIANGLPEPLPEEPVRSLRYRLLPAAIALAGLMAVGSGIYLYIQGQELWRKARAGAAPAELREPSLSHSAPIVPTSPVVVAPPPAPAPLLAQNAPRAELVDQVHTNAMAPVRNQAKHDDAAGGAAPLVIQARARNVALRAGPGTEFRLLGTANPEIRYIVSGWKDRWFKVLVNSEDLADETAPTKTAWIRNDLVELISGQ